MTGQTHLPWIHIDWTSTPRYRHWYRYKYGLQNTIQNKKTSWRSSKQRKSWFFFETCITGNTNLYFKISRSYSWQNFVVSEKKDRDRSWIFFLQTVIWQKKDFLVEQWFKNWFTKRFSLNMKELDLIRKKIFFAKKLFTIAIKRSFERK